MIFERPTLLINHAVYTQDIDIRITGIVAFHKFGFFKKILMSAAFTLKVQTIQFCDFNFRQVQNYRLAVVAD